MSDSRANSVKRWTMACLLLAAAMLAAYSSSAQGRIPWRLGRSANQKNTYVGETACMKCHRDIAAKYARSAMSRALTPGTECETLRSRVPLAFTLHGVTYRIERAESGFSYTLTNGRETLTMPLLWCFGEGVAGITFVVLYEGVYYETRVSYFSSFGGLEITPGQTREASPSLKAAIGQPQSNADVVGCFTCHSTPLPQSTGVAFEQFLPSIRCEACHGPGSAHLAAQGSDDLNTIRQAIFNPARLSPDEMNQILCGACHRSWDTVMQLPNHGGAANVRFQPYRLANSKCYLDPNDSRIGCIACHDPHGPLVREIRTYDAKCLACHQGGESSGAPAARKPTEPACPKAVRDCVSCHMPKIEPAGLFFKFTDHHIRIVRPGGRDQID